MRSTAPVPAPLVRRHTATTPDAVPLAPDTPRPPAARGQRLMEHLAFLRGFLRDPVRVGALVPSSRQLEQRIVQHADLAQARTVVELGPGTGGTTRALLEALPAHGRLLALERDARFQERLHTTLTDPRLTAVHSDAEYLAAWLIALQLPAPDVIVSGIPFSTLPADTAQRILSVVAQVLAPGGRFVAYQLRAHVSQLATPLLGAAQPIWAWRNLPPMRVWVWRREGAQTPGLRP